MEVKVLPRISEVAPTARPLTLRVRWDSGESTNVDVSDIINIFKIYAPLRGDPELFRRVRVGEYGTDIVWSDEIDMSNDTLWRLAHQQAPLALRKAK